MYCFAKDGEYRGTWLDICLKPMGLERAALVSVKHASMRFTKTFEPGRINKRERGMLRNSSIDDAQVFLCALPCILDGPWRMWWRIRDVVKM